MHLLKNASRRQFLRQAGVYGQLLGGAAPLAMHLSALGAAAARGDNDYRAIVCVFLYGGNDAYNTVLPTDRTAYGAYLSVRNLGSEPIALRRPGTPPDLNAVAGTPARLGGMLPVRLASAASRESFYALHPLLREVRTLFQDQRRIAVLPNIGPLVLPTSKAQFAQTLHPRPTRLFSHNDQQNTWQALAPEGSTRGWGGRLADQVQASNGQPLFTAVSATGNTVWLAGDQVQAYQVGTGGAIRLGVDGSGQLFDSAVAGAALQRLVTQSRRGHPLERDIAATASRSIQAEALLRTALQPASELLFGTPPPAGVYDPRADPKLRYDNPLTGQSAFNSLAGQLQVVARLVDAGRRGATGVRRQVFFVSLGGFDTHSGQNSGHAQLMARLSHALGYFDTSLGALGGRDQVTTFTASDFGRSFTSNGDGTDHGWGGHQFVMGGAVRGGDFYGAFPRQGYKNANNNEFDGSPDQLANGALLPRTSVDQLGYTLGQWFGVPRSALLDIFPNLANFNAGVHDLGFLRA
jgi:uncharacterized protein (DUF1501 family)